MINLLMQSKSFCQRALEKKEGKQLILNHKLFNHDIDGNTISIDQNCQRNKKPVEKF